MTRRAPPLPRLRSTPLGAWAVGVGLLAAGINAAVVAYRPPAPRVHDEFAYLLAADTLAAGRLSNPTHPHWRHFETMHVLQRPTYNAKYPPGQGLVLAVGQRLTGTPRAGLCLARGLAAAAAVWMLRAWVATRWAVVGGLLLALHTGVQLQWGAGYWGGALAYAAGAAVLGGGARLAGARGPLTPAAVGFAVGAVALSVTRPFEGAVVVAGAATVVLASRLRRGDGDWGRFVRHAALPAALVGAAGIAALLAYNLAVTGHPLTMPYVLYERQYGVTPIFVWQPQNLDRVFRHEVLAKFNFAAAAWSYQQQQTALGFLFTKGWFTGCVLSFYLPGLAALLAVVGLWAARRRIGPWLLVALVTWLAACNVVWMFPHYLAPAAPVLLLAVVAGARVVHAAAGRRRPQFRRLLVPSLLGVQLLLFCVAATGHVLLPRETWADARAAFAERLRETPGRDLVFVRYQPTHHVHDEWVYNRADIDAAAVVWAREMDPASNAGLREHFSGRRVWTVYADERPPRIAPRPPEPATRAGRQRPATPEGRPAA